jgi:folate-binding protein YgfZ
VTPKGRIVDRALLLDRGESMLLVTSPAGRSRLAAWIRKYVLASEVKLTDITEETAAFALTGPAAADLVKPIAGVGVARIEPERFLAVPVEDVDTAIARFDALPSAWIFLAERPGILAVHERAVEAGAAPIGALDAEVLRVEAGIPADGHELTEDWNPWEARLEGSFSLSKGCYTGQEVLARLNTYDKIQRRLVGVRLGEDAPPAVPAIVAARDDGSGEMREVGTLTSAVASDRFGETLGLGFVRLAWEAPGAELFVGDDRRPARVSELPFD